MIFISWIRERDKLILQKQMKFLKIGIAIYRFCKGPEYTSDFEYASVLVLNIPGLWIS